MPDKCIAIGCKETGVYNFPNDPGRRDLWENATGIPKFKASPNSRLCLLHFQETDFVFESLKANDDDIPIMKMCLKSTAVPSIFINLRTPYVKLERLVDPLQKNLIAKKKEEEIVLTESEKNEETFSTSSRSDPSYSPSHQNSSGSDDGSSVESFGDATESNMKKDTLEPVIETVWLDDFEKQIDSNATSKKPVTSETLKNLNSSSAVNPKELLQNNPGVKNTPKKVTTIKLNELPPDVVKQIMAYPTSGNKGLKLIPIDKLPPVLLEKLKLPSNGKNKGESNGLDISAAAQTPKSIKQYSKAIQKDSAKASLGNPFLQKVSSQVNITMPQVINTGQPIETENKGESSGLDISAAAQTPKSIKQYSKAIQKDSAKASLGKPFLQKVSSQVNKTMPQVINTGQPIETDTIGQKQCITVNSTNFKRSEVVNRRTMPQSTPKEAKLEISRLNRVVRNLRKKSTELKSLLKKKRNFTYALHLVTKNMTTAGKLFTRMQTAAIKSRTARAKYSMEERILALSLYRQSPAGYKLLSALFRLPSLHTLQNFLRPRNAQADCDGSEEDEGTPAPAPAPPPALPGQHGTLEDQSQIVLHEDDLIMLLEDGSVVLQHEGQTMLQGRVENGERIYQELLFNGQEVFNGHIVNGQLIPNTEYQDFQDDRELTTDVQFTYGGTRTNSIQSDLVTPSEPKRRKMPPKSRMPKHENLFDMY